MQAALLRLLLTDRHACFEVRRLDIRDEPPLDARYDAILQALQVLGRAVTGEDDLLALRVQDVERVEELFLHPLLALEELHVVDEQDVRRAESIREAVGLAVFQRRDELAGELLARDKYRPGANAQAFVRHGVHDVGLPETDAAVDEERVEGCPTGVVRDGVRGAVCHLVAATDDERLENVA